MYSASKVAYAFAQKGIDEGNPITQMKLQKMVFFAHGYHLATYNGLPLIRDKFQAWKFGPVVPIIYRDYKAFGNTPIIDLELVGMFSPKTVVDCEFNKSALDAISFTWESTKDISALTLSNWTHQPGTPWSEAYKPYDTDIIISNELIEAYFKKILQSE